jgi:hypothetical protein
MAPLEGAVWFLLAFAGNPPEHLRNTIGFNTATYGPFGNEADCLSKLQAMKLRPPGAACRDLAGFAGPGPVHRCTAKARLEPNWTCVSLDRNSAERAKLYERVLLREPLNFEAQAGYAAQRKAAPWVICGFAGKCVRWKGPPIVCRYPDRDPLYSDSGSRDQAAVGSEEECRRLRRVVERP